MSNALQGFKIGFAGLGKMGAPMARHLHRAGAEMVAWNRSEAPRVAAEADGMAIAESPAELARRVGAGVICLNLTTPDVVDAVVFGEDGIAAGMADDALIVDFGTTGVLGTRKFADQLGGRWVDAPVSGGQVGAEAASLTIMAGGDEADFRRVEPILGVVGGKVSHLGPTGAGQVTKLANQLIVAQTIDAVAQALRLAELAGLDAGQVREALRGGFAESRILELHGERMVRRDFAPGGRSTLQLKDVRLICELAESLGLRSSALANCRQVWEDFVERDGHGDLDHSGLFTIYT